MTLAAQKNSGRGVIMGTFGKLKGKIVEVGKQAKEMGQDDPRRIIHSLKVGLALTTVSLFYYFRPLYHSFGSFGMWAILTVVVVFEFTVGGTLSKAFNRGFATAVAGALGVGAAYLANLLGGQGEPILLGFLVFLLGAASTFTRFYPSIKRKYDYGVLVFILTFCLVAISGYRVDKIVELAYQRLSTIIAGAATCFIISIFICPAWAGEELHNQLVHNLENLASFLEGFGVVSFKLYEDGVSDAVCNKSFPQEYKSILTSKAIEEFLANLAWWEPGHAGFRFCHPWKLYLKVGVLARQCAYQFEALTMCTHSTLQEPSEMRRKVEELCIQISSESGKALKELAMAMKTLTPVSVASIHLQNCKSAIEEFKAVAVEYSTLPKKADLLQILPVLTIASILVNINKCVESIFESTNELSIKAQFKINLVRTAIIPVTDCDGEINGNHVVVIVHQLDTSTSAKSGNSQAL